MGMNFTPEQQKVIELHNSNILVSAAAGSGKTAVLVERIIRMICEGEHPADIDRLLIVTFTNAAAAEMRERIAARDRRQTGSGSGERPYPEAVRPVTQCPDHHDRQLQPVPDPESF